MLINKLSHEKYCINRGMIFLNFSDPERKLTGCRFKCSFCAWSATNYSKRLVPSNAEITEFICEYFKPFFNLPHQDLKFDVHITGGGDPLYNFEENKQDVTRILKCITDLDCTISIVTREWETVKKYWKTDLSSIKTYIFSYETLNSDLRDLCLELIAAGKTVQLTKIFNLSFDVDKINWDDIKNFIAFYKNIPVYFRENFAFPWPDDVFIQQREKLYEFKGSEECGEMFYLRPAELYHAGLYQNEVWNTEIYDKMVRTGEFKNS